MTIFNSGNLNFFDNSTAGNATISVLSGGYVSFNDNSTGGNVRFITDNDLNSTVDFTGLSTRRQRRRWVSGSIEGGGTFIVGNNNLIVGSNNLPMTITGMIDLCNCGILTKVGSGTMTLAPSADLSLFDGSLVVNGGTVVVDNDSSAAAGATVIAGGTLAGGASAPSALLAAWINGGTLLPGGNGSIGTMVARLGLKTQPPEHRVVFVLRPALFCGSMCCRDGCIEDFAPCVAPSDLVFVEAECWAFQVRQLLAVGTLKAIGS